MAAVVIGVGVGVIDVGVLVSVLVFIPLRLVIVCIDRSVRVAVVVNVLGRANYLGSFTFLSGTTNVHRHSLTCFDYLSRTR